MSGQLQTASAVVVALLIIIGAALATPSVGAQQPTVKTTDNGFHVEEVRVGDSCVVVVSSSGRDQPVVTATPCVAF